MVQTTGIERLKQARARLILNKPFWGTAAIALKFKVNNEIKCARTDGKSLEFNEAWINEMPIEQVEFLVCHEVMHCIMLHPLRIKTRDHVTANKAMDYSINGILTRSGLTMPEGGLYDEKLSDKALSFEAVYAILMKDQKQEQKPESSKNGNPDPEKPSEDGSGAPNGTNPEADPADKNGDPQPGKPGPGQPEPWQIGEVKAATAEDGSPMNESEEAQLEQEWKITATQALKASQNCGKTPDGMARLIQDLTVEKRDLEDVIRDFIIKTLNGDYTWSKPNKRHLIHGIYTPSVQGEVIPEIVMVMDTSGSIGDTEVNYFTAKLNAVLNEYNTTVHVVYCDTSCHAGGEYGPSDLPVVLKPVGGGGTDFRKPFEFLKIKDIIPTCLIYFTDGYCDLFPKEPDYPVLWALYGNERTFPFGTTVNITPEL